MPNEEFSLPNVPADIEVVCTDGGDHETTFKFNKTVLAASSARFRTIPRAVRTRSYPFEGWFYTATSMPQYR
jgi:hypothetical protein